MNVRHLHRKRMAWTVLLVLLLSVAGLTKAFAQPEGALNGVFTINANGDKVLFSQGNLQYIGSAATPYWKFADHQWDYLGNNGQNSSSQTADRDLFGWGTSGYHHNNTAYQPWTTSGSISYYAYGRSSYNLYDQTGQADWGYNAISNGGNQENSGWRTLTNDEWGYVFNTRTDAASKYGHGKVNGKKGMILLPDAWTTPEGLGFTSGNSNWTNVYSSEQWAQMEQNGAVFLPAAGYRDGTSVYVVGSYGYYWSSSCSSNSSHACYVYFSSGDLGPQYNNYRYHGQSVRLVQTIQQTTHTIEVSPNPVEGGTVMGGGTFEVGQPCTVTATANDGYTFANWTNNGTIVSTNSNYSFNVFGNMDLVANFMPEGNIDFADEAVKALCVANWDTDGDGELSYDEAAAVTSLGYVFYNNTEITSFEELQYFTGLTSIGNYAFYYCRNLTGSLIIPNSVTSIGNYAFYLCNNLTGSLVIPNSVTTINSHAFFRCWGFEGNLNIPNSVTSIGDAAFYGCDFSGPLSIPNSVISIGDRAFGECYDFTGELTIPSSVTYIGSEAFQYCSGFTGCLTIPSSVTDLGYNPFIGCSGFEQIVVDPDNAYFDSRENCNAIIRTADNTLVTGCNNTVVPNSVTSIGICAFTDCSGIISIEIPNGVTSIGDAAFVNCTSLTTIEIPNTVTSINYGAFGNCNNLTSLAVLAENPPTLGESVFEGVPLSISVYVPCGSEETYASQSWGGFNNFQGLCGGTVTVAAEPEEGGTVTGGGLFEAGQACTVTATVNEGYTFANWTNNNGVIVSNNSTYTFHVANDMALVAHFVPEGNIDFADANVKALCVANWDTNGDGELSYAEAAAVTDLGNVFYHNTVITSFEELQYFVGLTSIGEDAFYYCTNLTGSLIIPNSVTSIGDYAFYYCFGFTGNLTIPNYVTTIGNSAFFYCAGFTGDLIIPNSVTSIGKYAFSYCYGFTGDLVISENVNVIRGYAFMNCHFTSIHFNATNCQSVGYNDDSGEWNDAFQNNTSLEQIVIGDNVVQIPAHTFENTNAQNCHLSLGNSLQTIGANAFYNNENGYTTGLAGNLVFPASLTSIGDNAFSYNYNLSGNLEFPSSLLTIGNNVFNDCTSLTGILTIPENVTRIGMRSFVNCRFSEIHFNAVNCESMGWDENYESLYFVFWLNSNLREIVIGENVTQIPDYAFGAKNSQNCHLTFLGNAVTRIGDYAFLHDEENDLGLVGELIIPSSVTEIGNCAFYGCDGLNTIYAQSATPPTAGNYTFYGINADIPVYVPCGSMAMETYSSATGWNWFTNYYEDCIHTISALANPMEGGEITIGKVLFSEPFEEYVVGNQIATEASANGHAWWTTWSDAPGSEEDGTVAVIDNKKCGHFTYGNDQVLRLGNKTSGIYNLEFDIMVPEGKCGYFNVLHNFAGPNSTWAMQCYLHATHDGQSEVLNPGHGTVHAGSNSTADVPCVYDEWMHFRVYVNIDADVARLYYTAPGEKESLTCEWQWSLDSFGEAMVEGTLDAMDFFPPMDASISEFYIDNFVFEQVQDNNFHYGEICRVSANANNGYRFVNWTEDNGVVSEDAKYSFEVTDSRDVVANFEVYINGYWSHVTTWPGNILPTAQSDVHINGNCVLDMDATVASLAIEEGGTLTIQSGMTLIVNEGFVNNGTPANLIIEDGAQLIHSVNGVVATVRKDISSYNSIVEDINNGWHLIASPVVGNLAITSIENMTANDYDLYYYDEPTYYWMNHKYADNDFTELESGSGYLYANSGSVIMYSFENTGLDGWTTIDADGDGYNWEFSTIMAHHGNGCVESASYDDNIGALTPDNYIVSPQVSFTSSSCVSFWACAQDDSYAAEHFGVAVSTASNTNPADFTTIEEWTMTAKSVKAFGNWYQYTVNLGQFAGQTGYVALRHFNSQDMYYINVDEISFKGFLSEKLSFAGELENGSAMVNIPLSYTETAGNMKGFNLIGNPFVHNVTSYGSINVAEGCFRMNETQDDLMVSEVSEADPLKTAEGFFVKATAEGASITFNPQRGATMVKSGSVRVEVSEDNQLIDRLLVKGSEGQPLEKFSLNEQRTKVFAIQGQKEFAIVPCEGNEQPFSFKAAKDGNYTITVNADGMECDYLHLIDNLTGNDVDLLVESSYTFESKTTDYASRFRLVFSTDDAGWDACVPGFAFINGSGNLCILGIEGEATLQVVDMLGHVIGSETFIGSYEKKLDVASGVYMLRLINGDDVKVQKIVIK